MKQISMTFRTGSVDVRDVPPPEPADGEVLVRTRRSVISAGTEVALLKMGQKGMLGKAADRPDLARQVIDKALSDGLTATARAVFSRLEEPVPLGYSSAGRVLEVGREVEGIRPGDAVACAGAEKATHAEVVSVPENLCAKIPDTLIERLGGAEAFEAAAFTTLGAIAMQGVRVADVQLGDRVGVSGLGLIGLLTVQILSAAGCRAYGFDPIEERCELARQLGARGAWSEEEKLQAEVGKVSDGHGLDAVLLTASTDSDRPVEFGAQISREKGRVVVVGDVGLDVPRAPYYDKELELRFSRSYGPGRYDRSYEEKGLDYPYGYVRWTEGRNMSAVLELMADGKLRTAPLVSRRATLDEAPSAYRELQDGEVSVLGVVLDYPHEGPASVSAAREGGERMAVGDAEPDFSAGVAAPDRVRAGVFGAGNFASSVLLPELADNDAVTLDAVCTRTGLSGSQAAERFGFQEATTDPEVLFADPDLDALFVVTRHDTHAQYVKRGLRRGKHVFTEKPLCLNRSELSEIVSLLDARAAYGGSETRPLLTVGFNRRFAPLTSAIRDRFGGPEKPLSVVYRVNADPLPADHWVYDREIGGGRVVGEVCHFVDWIQHLVAARPVRVTAEANRGDERRRADEGVTVTLRFADGSIGSVHYVAVEDRGMAKERVEVFGSRTSAVLENFREAVAYGSGGRERLSRAMLPPQEKGHAQELEAFLTAVTSGGDSPVSEREAVWSTEVTFAAEQSLRTGKPVEPDLAWT